MELVLAEKKSVAYSIARCLKANKQYDGYFCNDHYIITWSAGHFFELSKPEKYDQKYKKWVLSDLPFLPERLTTQIKSKHKKQFGIIKALAKDDRVKTIICATDAGREGELIFRLIYEKLGVKKPVKRLWISSLEHHAILNGFETLKPAVDYDNIYQAARARMEADYLVGINMSRFYSLVNETKFNVGRVQTPVINLIVERQREIDAFEAKSYFTILADCHQFIAYNRVDDSLLSKKIV